MSNDRPSCYPAPPDTLSSGSAHAPPPFLDVLTSPVPAGMFPSPVDHRHVLCLHLGEPVPVSYRAGRVERQGVRLHGQFCVVPAGSSTLWTMSHPARSLLLRLSPSLLRDTGEAMGLGEHHAALVPSIHIRDPQIEHIGWMMQAEDRDAYPSGRLFTDSLAAALAARLLALQSQHRRPQAPVPRALPTWRLNQVIEYIEAHLDQDLTLAELAAVAGFSVSHFKPLFREAVGKPAHRFVLERRVERARWLLQEARGSITEVAIEAGFAHASHMARCMRQVLGVSPSQIAGRDR
ncbi:AraC family transcriptional regulator [Dyella amyloliquefaciens]|uniref:AraC family transcriptional regulator n=1 Tax=Dyella amyloliquefaciens TaxID=1770545 RepID=UPI00102E3E42|nr:AraC family transcriptional regulator [Dyella amyloliquefaciens]